jgi:cation diffusion facilitator CzcD-associated flavoprotein CzcO
MATKQSGVRAAGVTAVIGAGPHGLAATAHLRAAGLDVRMFGEPLEFWQRHMPAGMLLRSRKAHRRRLTRSGRSCGSWSGRGMTPRPWPSAC